MERFYFLSEIYLNNMKGNSQGFLVTLDGKQHSKYYSLIYRSLHCWGGSVVAFKLLLHLYFFSGYYENNAD